MVMLQMEFVSSRKSSLLSNIRGCLRGFGAIIGLIASITIIRQYFDPTSHLG